MENTNIKDLIKEEQHKYFKEWRKNNKDKVKKHNQNYWEKRVQKRLETEQKEV